MYDLVKRLRERDIAAWDDAYSCRARGTEAADAIEALQARVAELEADAKRMAAQIAIKGGDQNYPTLWAYEQACAALDKHRARADQAEAALTDARRDALEEAAKVAYECGSEPISEAIRALAKKG